MYLCGGSPDFVLFPYLDYWSDPLQRFEFGIRKFLDTLYTTFRDSLSVLPNNTPGDSKYSFWEVFLCFKICFNYVDSQGKLNPKKLWSKNQL
jgi:hypothetical protein